jgi:hypothetical protein
MNNEFGVSDFLDLGIITRVYREAGCAKLGEDFKRLGIKVLPSK